MNTTAGTTTTALPLERTYGVGRRDITVVDTSRPTAASPKRGLAAKPSRTLPVMILYPTTGPSADPAPVKGAKVAPGRFPLVEFSHGVTANGPIYTFYIRWLARAGYIVVAPTFPLTSGPGGWTDLADYKNQPADVSFVLTKILALDTTAGDPLRGHLEASEVAVAGHSLGAITTFGFVNSCCVDKRVKAAIELSGVRLPFKGRDFPAGPPLPMLLIHGDADPTVPYAGSAEAFAQMKGPLAFISDKHAGHTDVVAKQPYVQFSIDTAIGFLDLELRHDPTHWNALAAEFAKTEDATLSERGRLPAPGHA